MTEKYWVKKIWEAFALGQKGGTRADMIRFMAKVAGEVIHEQELIRGETMEGEKIDG